MTAFVSFLRSGDSQFRWVRVFALAMSLVALMTLGHLPLLDEDEGEYSEVAAEMASSGHYLTPTLNQTPFYEKPILLFWAQQPFVQLFGPSEWSFRMPSLLASGVLFAVLFNWVRKRKGDSSATATLVTFAFSLGAVIACRAATMDLLVLLFLTLTLLFYWDFLETQDRKKLRYAYCWAALGFLTKGPMAIVIPGLVAIFYRILPPRPSQRLVSSFDLPGLMLFLGIGLPWFLWYDWQSAGAFSAYFFFRENIGRVGGSLQGHSGSLFYYVLVLPLIVLPFSALIFGGYKALREEWQVDSCRYLTVWFLVVFVVFTLAGTKLPHYLLYGLPPLFILGSQVYINANKRFWILLLPALLLPLLALSLPILVNRYAISSPNPYLAEMFWQGRSYFDLSFTLKVLGWVGLTVLLFWMSTLVRSVVDRLKLVAAMGLLSAFGVSLVLLPAVTFFQQAPVREAAALARTLEGPVVSDNRMPSFSVYLGHPTEVRAPRAGDIAFGRLDHPDRLGSRYEVLYAKQGIRLVRVLAP